MKSLPNYKKKEMKKGFYLLLILVFNQVQAQKDFQGLAVYESKTQAPKFEGVRTGNRDITPEMQKSMEERLKKMLEKTFILNFDKSASIYKEEEKLETPGQQKLETKFQKKNHKLQTYICINIFFMYWLYF